LNEQKPLLVVIAGPMGAGKTTFYEAYLREAFPTLVPPVPHQREAMLREHRSFAVEDLVVDTELLENARDAGYATSLTMPARVKTFFDFFCSLFSFSGTQLRSLRRVVLVVPLNSASTTTARS
jgi:GTPase SAR1 family protein